MLKQKIWLAGLAFAFAAILIACRTPAPTPELTSTTSPSTPVRTRISETMSVTQPTLSTLNPDPPTPTPVPPTATQAPPTATPLPTWPTRWEPAGGPQGGAIEAVAIDARNPNVLYAGGMGGTVYRSNDYAATWLPGKRFVAPSCALASVIVDASARDTVYAASPCAGVFKSSNGGASWLHTSAVIDGGVPLLVQSPHAPGLLLAADHTGNVYRSQDAAATWELVSDGLPGGPVRSLAASGPETYWATTAGVSNGSLYRYTAGFWSAVPFGQPPETNATDILVDLQNPAVVFVGLEYPETAPPQPDTALLYRSTDGGLSWIPLQAISSSISTDGKEAQTSRRIRLLGQAHPSGVLYIADDGQLMSSTDAGDTWRRIESPDPTNAIHDLRHIAIDPTDNDVLYLPLRNNGIVKSTDSGRTWKTVNDGLVNTQIGFITTHPADPAALYAGSAVDLRTFRSLDYGSSWTLLDGAGTEHSATQRVDELRLDPKHPDTIYRVVDTASAFRSDDAGGTWSTTWPDFRFSSIYSLATAPTYPSILYAGKSGYGLFRSDDRGNTWRFLPQSGVDVTYALAVHPENGDFVLSGDAQKPPGTAAELHRSRDGGATWDVPLTVPNATGITSVAFDPRVELVFRQGAQPDDPTRLYAASAGPRGRLWFSNDAGDSWKPLNDDLNFTNVQALAVVPHRPGVAYAGLWGGGTWRTEDGGLNWHRLSGDPAMSAVAIAVDPSNHNVVYIADGTTPHLYRSTDDGNTWELLFDAGADYDRIAALALAPSDPSILYVSVARATHHPANGAVFRVDTSAPIGENASDITGDLPGIASSLAVHRRDPRRAFATVADHGVWKTSDDGTSWQQVKSGLPDVNFSGIVADPVHAETLFVTGGYDLLNTLSQHTNHDADQKHGIWKSTDDGNTWVRLGGSTFGQASGPINAIAFHPKDDRVMYAAGETGIFLSPDQGETWTNISGRLPAVPMSAVATDGEALYAGSVGAGVFPGIIYPLINTADWSSESLLSAPVAHIQITLHPDDSQTLYASAYPGGVFKTTDGGTTWSAHNRDLPSFSAADASRQGHYALAVSPSAPDVLYLGLYAQGIFRSDDGAETWRPVFGEDGELQHATVQTLLVHPDDAEIVYVATEEGVWRTVNGARTWSNYGAGLPGAGDVRSLVRGVDDQLYGGSRGYGLYTRSAFHQTGEDTWRQLSEMGNWGTPSLAWDERPLYQHTSLLLLAGDSNTLYAGTFPSGVYKTIDGGTVWREQNAGLQTDGVLTLVSNPADHQILYAGTSSGISRSIDGATTWHAWEAGWPPQQRVSSIVVDPTNPDTLYASSKGSTNPEGDGGTVMKSTDGGATWFPITVGLGSDLEFHTILLDRFDPNIVYLATQSDGVFISRDSGATWSSWNEGLWNRVTGSDHHFVKDILQLSADGRLLYLGTSGSGVWRRPAEGAP